MRMQPRRAVAWLPALFLPLLAVAAPGLGCEFVVGDVDLMLVDGSPDDVLMPMTLDGYACKICKDVSPDADFTGDAFPEAEPSDGAQDSSTLDAEASTGDAGKADAGAEAGHDAGPDGA